MAKLDLTQKTISLSVSDEHWMNLAIEMALSASDADEVPVGALLIHRNKIIGLGKNRRESLGRTVAHAEIMALEDFNRRSKQWRVPQETSLYVTVEPCMMCTGALLWARVDHIYFGCSDPKKAGIQRLSPYIQRGIYDHRFQTVKSGVLSERCSTLLTSYFRKKRHKPSPAPAPLPN